MPVWVYVAEHLLRLVHHGHHHHLLPPCHFVGHYLCALPIRRGH